MAGLAWLTCRHRASGSVSSLVANSLAGHGGNGTDADQIGTVLEVAQGGWIWLASGPILWES